MGYPLSISSWQAYIAPSLGGVPAYPWIRGFGDVYIAVVTDYIATEVLPKTGNAAGYDFGIKTLFTCSEGIQYDAPEYYKANLKQLALAQRKLARKQKGSRNRERSRKAVARVHRKVKRQRADWHWKLANNLCIVRMSSVLRRSPSKA